MGSRIANVSTIARVEIRLEGGAVSVSLRSRVEFPSNVAGRSTRAGTGTSGFGLGGRL